ncbi:MAG: hypothetical protein J0M04_09095 [Verrucomicrobia bacterium]|nr:hypothetical protein [Verrucomicrobiota bacterium]
MNLSIPRYQPADVWRGVTIYAGGDTAAALLLGEFHWGRMLGMALVGGGLYALEIPAWFRWIDRRVTASGAAASLRRTVLAMAYFNPLWIARHLLLIKLFSGLTNQIGWGLLRVGAWSFLANIPISLAGNFVVQNLLPLRHRFLGSAIFSALMAVYYAVSTRWFH